MRINTHLHLHSTPSGSAAPLAHLSFRCSTTPLRPSGPLFLFLLICSSFEYLQYHGGWWHRDACHSPQTAHRLQTANTVTTSSTELEGLLHIQMSASPSFPDRGPSVEAVAITTLVIASVFVFARLYSRVAIVKKATLDDFFILVAWV